MSIEKNEYIFGVNEFEVGVNDGILSGNEQQKVYYIHICIYIFIKFIKNS